MEMLEGLLNSLMMKSPLVGVILMILGGIVVLAQIVVALTPSKNDDAIVSKIKNLPVIGQVISFLETFAPLQKKEGGGLSMSVAKSELKK